MKLFMFHKYTVNARLLQCLTTKTIKKGWFVFLLMRRVILLIWGSCTTHVHQYYFGTVFMLFEFFFRDEIRSKMKNKYLSNPDYNYEKVNRASLACGPMVKWAIAQVCKEEVENNSVWDDGEIFIFHENKMLVKCISWKIFARKFNDQGDIHLYFF